MSAPATPDPGIDRRGLVYGISAFLFWGVVALYWKLLEHVDPVEVIAHRVVWGLVVFAILAHMSGAGARVLAAARDLRSVGAMALSGALIAINWGIFILAVANGHLLDASLGYFINPLVSVALGTIVLRERLRPLQWVALAFAAAGVTLLTTRAGQVPWISLTLAATFGLYGLVRKVVKVDTIVGSTLETALIAPIGIAYLVYLAATGRGGLGHAPATTELLLVSTGIITAAPLLLFTSAARRLPLSTIGFLQYIGPTGQFVIALAVFGEPLAHGKLAAFGFIWIGLVAFSIDLWRAHRARL